MFHEDEGMNVETVSMTCLVKGRCNTLGGSTRKDDTIDEGILQGKGNSHQSSDDGTDHEHGLHWHRCFDRC